MVDQTSWPVCGFHQGVGGHAQLRLRIGHVDAADEFRHPPAGPQDDAALDGLLDLPQPLQRAVGNELAKAKPLQVDHALPHDDSFLAEPSRLGLDRPAGISAQFAADAHDPVAGAAGP